MRCPCCEQEIVDRSDLVFSAEWRAVTRFGKCAELTPLQYKILDALRRRSRTNEQLIALVYGHRSDGGPETAKNVIHVSINQMNRRLEKISLRVGAERVGPHAPIKIMSLAP